MMDALLIVDLQNDFMPDGALGVKKADEVVPIINHLVGKFSLVIASQDWHPKNHVSFAKTHGMKVGETIEVNGEEQILWPVHCVEHTHGAALVKELSKERIMKYVHKGNDPKTDSYSVFKGMGFDVYLREKGVTKLFLAGLTTEYCVMYTALDALDLGYAVAVIRDACCPVDPAHEKEAIEKMRRAGAQIVSSKSL